MLSSVLNQAIIPLLIFISFSRHQIQAEDEHDFSLESSTPLASPQIAEDLMDQNSNWNCARLEAFQDTEKIFNSTDDSAEANVNREEYHSRIKRCIEKKRQDIIIREFERRIQKQEMREGKLKETHYKNNNIHKNNQNKNQDSTLLDDLYQTMSYSENTEPYSRKYRTLPVNLTPLTNDLLSTSSSQNDRPSSTEPSSFTSTIKKLKESRRNIVSFSPKNILSREPKDGETLSLSTAPCTIPRIKARQRKKNNPELRSTKVTENDGKRKKGLLRNLLCQVSEVMEGGALKHSVDMDESDLNEKSSSTYPDEESIEYETVTSPKFSDHFTKSSDISTSGRSHDQQENSIIQKIREDTKKQLQSKIEELEKLREKMAEIIRQAQLTKNQTKISPLVFDKISAKHETKIIDENFKNNANFNQKLDSKSIQSIQKNQIGIQTVQKATISEIPSKDLQKQHFSEKRTTLMSSPRTQSTERQEKFTSGSQATLKNLPTQRIEFHNLHTTVLPSSEMYSSKHHNTNHEQPLKAHLQNENLLKNHNQKDSPLQARSEDDENSNYHLHITQKVLSTASIKQSEQSSKFGSTPSTINISQTKQTQKPLRQLGSSSEGPSLTQSLHMKNNPDVFFQTSLTKLPSSSTTLRHVTSPENPAMVEIPHSGKRSTLQASEAKLPTTQPINISTEKATFLDHSIYDKSTTTHFHINHEKYPKSALAVSEEALLKTGTASQHRNPPQESTASLNHRTTRGNSLLSLNRDDVSSVLVGKSHSSVADQLHDIHHPTTISKSTTQLLLDKITQLTPFYNVEEWKKIINSGKHYLDGKSTHQPIQSHKGISPENISTEKSHVGRSTLPLVHHSSSEISPYQQPHLPLKVIKPQKSSPLIHSHLNSDDHFSPHPRHSIEVTLPVRSHTENYPAHHPNHKIALEKVQEKISSTPHLVHLPQFKSDGTFSSHKHHINKVTLPIKLHKGTHKVHQTNHQSRSTEIPLKKITLEKIQEESDSISHLIHSPKLKSDEIFSPNPHHFIDVTLPMKSYTENHSTHQPSNHHPLNHHHLSISTEMPLKRSTLEKTQDENSIHSQKFKNSDENFTPHPHHFTEVTTLMKSLAENHPIHQSNHDSFHSVRTHPKKITLEEARGESSSTSHSVHHSSKFNPDENFTPHPTHSIGVTLPVNLHRLNPHHHELQKFDKFSTLEPTHSTESFLKKITSIEKAQDESSPSSRSVHLHSKSKHIREFPTPKKALPVKLHMKGFTSPMKSYSENQAISQSAHHHHHHQELIHFDKTPTPSHSTEINFREKNLPRDSQEIAHVTPLSHSSTTQLKNTDTPTPNILEEIKRLEKEKLEEIKNLKKKQFELLHKSHSHHLAHTTSSDFEDVFSEQKTSKHPLIDSTPSHKETHSIKNTAQGRSASEQSINSLHTHDITKPYPTHFTPPTILPNDEMVDMPLPPLNPNDNWKYLKKLDEWYEKQKAKSSTIKPPTIRPPSATLAPRPWITPSSTVAPMTVPPRLRPVTPSRNRTAPNQRPNSPFTAPTTQKPPSQVNYKTAPNQKPNSTVKPTTNQKPPQPVNYHIDSTINRSYNITINLVTPDSAPRENEERREEEAVDNPSSDPINEAGYGNDFDPRINYVRSTAPSKITKNEPTGDFDSLPHPSLPRELPSQSTHLADSRSVDETTPLPQSFTTIQMKNSLKDNSPLTSTPSENDTLLQSSTRSDSKRLKHIPTTTTLHKKLKNPSSKVQTDSTTPASITLATDGKIDLPALPRPLSFTGNCTPACNNYIIIIPNKTEEIIQILHKNNDQTPLTDQSAILQTSRSAQNGHTSDPNSSSDIKSLLEPIIKAKMTPSNNTELRKSINELMMSLKQRRFNEYAKLYQNKLNPMVGEGRDSIVAISQINEYIELLELMLVYLARDPDKLLDEKKDARVDNFESPYAKDDPQRRLIEDQFHYVHPKILNEFIDVYKKYGNGERYYGRPAWQFAQENEPRGRSSRPRSSGGLLSNLFNFKGLVQPLLYTYNRAPMNRPDTQYYDN